MAKYLTVSEINLRIDALASNPDFTGLVSVFSLNHNSADGNTPIKCLKIGKSTIPKPTPVLIIGGIHAREWAPPDSLFDFAERLLAAFKGNKAYVDPRFVMTNSEADKDDAGYLGRIVFDETEPRLFAFPQIEQVINTLELYIVPTVNPDGRAFSQTPGNIPGMTETIASLKPVAKLWWRKNRHNLGTCLDGSPAIGTDLNRNFDLPEQQFEKYYDSVSLTGPRNGRIKITNKMTSSKTQVDPFFDKFSGLSGGSEPETLNIMELITDKKIKFFLDVHSFHRSIYFPWGINENQISDPFLSQFNDKWDNLPANPASTRGRPLNDGLFTTNEPYQEFFPEQPGFPFLLLHQQLGRSMAAHITDAAGSDLHAQNRAHYSVEPSFSLYSAPGSSDDFAFSKQLEIDPNPDPIKGHKVRVNNKFPIFSLVIEAGHVSDGEFWPSQLATKNQFLKVRREIQFAVIGLLKFAANFSQLPAPLPPPSPQPTSSGKGCFPILLLLVSLSASVLYLIFSLI